MKRDRLLTQKQLAERWDVSPRTLERWRWLKEGPRYTKIGSAVRYSLADVAAFESTGLRATGVHMPDAPTLSHNPMGPGFTHIDSPECDCRPTQVSRGFAGIEPAIMAFASGEISIGRLRECFKRWMDGEAYKLPSLNQTKGNGT